MTEAQRQQVAVLVMRLRAIGDEWDAAGAEAAYNAVSSELETLANRILQRREKEQAPKGED